jgi:hypothetical protein
VKASHDGYYQQLNCPQLRQKVVTTQGENGDKTETTIYVIGHWSLVIGHWSWVIGHWSLVIGITNDQ